MRALPRPGHSSLSRSRERALRPRPLVVSLVLLAGFAALSSGAAGCGARGTWAQAPGISTARVPTAPATVTSPPPPAPRREAEHDTWAATSFGAYLPPKGAFYDDDGGYDLIFHFHAGQMAERDWRASHVNAVIVSATFGVGSGAYSDALSPPDRFGAMMAEVTHALRARTGEEKLHPRRITLLAWSAGYGSIREILGQPRYADLIDTVVLLDGLHTDYVKERAGTANANASPNALVAASNTTARRINEKPLGPFVAFAREAAAGHRAMVVTHSSIIPPDYASTTETAGVLMDAVKATREYTEEPDDDGRTLILRANVGDFHVMGYRGETKRDHIQQLHLVTRVMRDFILPRWERQDALR